VSLDGSGSARAELVEAPVYRRLRSVTGVLAELLMSPRYAEYESDFLSVTLTDQVRPEGGMDALRMRFPHILVLSHEPAGVVPDARDYRSRMAGRDDLGIAAEFVRHVRGAEATAGELALLASAFGAAAAMGDC
jgi:exonuclease SbcD